jgi:hypothetical protein
MPMKVRLILLHYASVVMPQNDIRLLRLACEIPSIEIHSQPYLVTAVPATTVRMTQHGLDMRFKKIANKTCMMSAGGGQSEPVMTWATMVSYPRQAGSRVLRLASTQLYGAFGPEALMFQS